MCQVGIFSLCLFGSFSAIAQNENFITQTVQINTRLHNFYGHPTWLLILRDEESQRVAPYLFDFHKATNFWVAFSFAHKYRITVSRLLFGPFGEIKNFCHLENRSMWGESLNITLKGSLSPVSSTSRCYVMRYHDYSFPIVNTDLEITPPN